MRVEAAGAAGVQPSNYMLNDGKGGITYWQFNSDGTFTYFNDTEKTKESTSADGTLTTVGDVGYVDDDGYLFLTDRATFMIISGGVNIYPQECENLLITHPKVADAAALAPRAGSRTRILRGPYLQSAMYRPSVFAKVGRFDESFRQGCDTDYVLRVVENGLRLVLDDGIAAYYRRHDANVTLDTAEMRREFMLASMKFAARNRLRQGVGLPEVFAELFMRRDQIEQDFGT